MVTCGRAWTNFLPYLLQKKILLYPSDSFNNKVQKIRTGEVSWKSVSPDRFIRAGLWPAPSSNLVWSNYCLLVRFLILVFYRGFL